MLIMVELRNNNKFDHTTSGFLLHFISIPTHVNTKHEHSQVLRALRRTCKWQWCTCKFTSNKRPLQSGKNKIDEANMPPEIKYKNR